MTERTYRVDLGQISDSGPQDPTFSVPSEEYLDELPDERAILYQAKGRVCLHGRSEVDIREQRILPYISVTVAADYQHESHQMLISQCPENVTWFCLEGELRLDPYGYHYGDFNYRGPFRVPTHLHAHIYRAFKVTVPDNVENKPLPDWETLRREKLRRESEDPQT